MKIKSLVFILLLTLGAQAQSLEWFENSFCRLQVPSGWGKAESDRMAFVRFWTPADTDPNGNLKESIDIEAGRVNGEMGMDMFGYMEKDKIEQRFPNMPLKVSKETKLGRIAAHRFEFVGKNNGKDMTLVEIFAIEGEKSYTLTYLGESGEYRRHSSMLDNVVRSFVGR